VKDVSSSQGKKSAPEEDEEDDNIDTSEAGSSNDESKNQRLKGLMLNSKKRLILLRLTWKRMWKGKRIMKQMIP
jgi:hypothetical protein